MIKQIRLINCQSWEDTTLGFYTDKLNVICADNNTGKSVIYKMLKVLGCPKYYSKEEMKDLIRWGAECATMYLLFEDGSIGMVSVYPTRVMYGYREIGKHDFYTSYEPFPDVLKKAGIISDVRGKFIANIIDTDQDMLLVNSDLSSNYDLMKLLILNDDLNAIRDRSEALAAQFKTVQMQLEVKDQKILSMLSAIEYVDTDKLESSLEKQRCSYDMMYMLIDAYRKCEVVADFFKEKVNYGEMFSVCNILTVLEAVSVRKILSTSRAVSPDMENALSMLEILESVSIPAVTVYRDLPDFAVSILEVLESVSVPAVTVYRDLPDFVINMLEDLESVSVNTMSQQFKLAAQANASAEQLRKDFVNSGTEYACPVYGEVVFDGEKCIPYR